MSEEEKDELDLLIEEEAEGDSSPPEQIEEEPQVETPETDTEDDTPGETETADTEDQEEIDGFQNRINKVTAQKHEFRLRAERAEKELEKLRNQSTPTEAPRLEDFDYDDERYQVALIDYKVGQETARIREELRKERTQSEQQRVAREWERRVQEANIPDYGPTVQTLIDSVPLPPHIVAAVQNDEKGPELAYYLAKHLDMADRIVSMDPVSAGVELGRISARLSAVKPKLTTKAPPPVKPVKAGGAKSKGLENMSMEDIDAWEPKARR